MLISLFIIFLPDSWFHAMPSLCPEVFYVKMINTQLAAQFITHMSVSFYTVFCWHLLMLFISCSVLFRRLYTRMKRNILPDCRVGLFSFYDGSSFELFFDFPSYFPFSCYLSGQYGSGEHDYFVFVYGYIDDDEPDDGDCFRDSCPFVGFLPNWDFLRLILWSGIVVMLLLLFW